MNTSTLIQAATSDGVKFAIAPDGKLKAAGKDEIVNKWLPTIREHKDEIIRLLLESSAIPLMTTDEEAAILDWLDRIDEHDPVTIGEVIDRCRSDLEARAYFLNRASE